MLLTDIQRLLGCVQLTNGSDIDVEVETVMASDGMSEILAFACSGALMITGLTNIQSVRTALVADACAIVYVRGRRPLEKALLLAVEKEIPVFATSLGMFDCCGILRSAGLKGAM